MRPVLVDDPVMADDPIIQHCEPMYGIRDLEEIFAFLVALDEAEASSDADTWVTASVSETEINLEPTRILTDRSPPKLFYRTFWRSLTRRMIQKEKVSCE